MYKKSRWPFELIIIISVFAVVLQAILFFGTNVNSFLIIGQAMLNIIYFIFLIFTIYRINEKSKSDNHTLKYFLTGKFRIQDIWIGLPLFALGKLAYFFLMKIEIIHVFGIQGITQISQLTSIQAWIFAALLVLYIPIVSLSEELYFRCYLFELQYLRFKNYTWIINGFSWSIFHLFTPTNFLALLPACLMYSYAYQRYRNIWITITAHLLMNITAFSPVIKSFGIF